MEKNDLTKLVNKLGILWEDLHELKFRQIEFAKNFKWDWSKFRNLKKVIFSYVTFSSQMTSCFYECLKKGVLRLEEIELVLVNFNSTNEN